ncbi:hypothetical protein GNE00_15355 [Pseudomonas sp. JL972]|uniref:hypothetical protein n=1 Tax=Stutzerimonas degradans TaxID=2968968 RepID=UPI0012D8A624|nr:hypothetical protein [Stutzerimonas degradans]MTZ15126.1 hypothetical protein [Stutzerimonas degradans]
MNSVSRGAIALSLVFPDRDEDIGATPFVEIDTLDLVDMAVDASAPASLINAIHASGRAEALADLILANIYEWAEADRPVAAKGIAEWLEEMAIELRRRTSFPNLDLKPERGTRLR